MSGRVLPFLAAAAALAGCFQRELPYESCGTTWCVEVREQLAAEPPGAAQAIDLRDGLVWVAFDGQTGLVQGYRLEGGELRPQDGPLRLTIGGKDEIPHPAGLTHREGIGTFLGHSPSGKGRLYAIDWDALRSRGVLDGALLHRVEDTESVRGARPELVRLDDRWLVATGDYGANGNEVRLYDPAALAAAPDTSAPGVLVARFPTTPYVQSLLWWDEERTLVLVQNTSFGNGWRLTFVDLEASVAEGVMRTRDVLALDLRGELEDIAILGSGGVLFVTNHRGRFAYSGTMRRR